MPRYESPSGKTIDSANFFNHDNYQGKIREVALMWSEKSFSKLEDALEFLIGEGYITLSPIILNRTHNGGSDLNEPVEAILLSRENNKGLIVKNYSIKSSPFEFYKEEQFKYIL